MLRVGVAQWKAAESFRQNLSAAQGLLLRAKAAGCQLLVLPEAFATGYDRVPSDERWRAAETEAIAELVRFAKNLGGSVVAGHVRHVAGGAESQAILATPKGVEAHYAKRALWSAEQDRLRPGSLPVVHAIAGRPVGFLVCYDLEFPELAYAYRAQGTSFLVAPAAFSTAGIWDIVTRARALETGSFLAAANFGEDGRFCGHSRVVAPDGATLAEVRQAEGVAVADCDPRAYEDWRKAHPYAADRLRFGIR